MVEGYYVILAGGVGAAKFIDGLRKVINPELLKIIINTGDDIELFGLKICPDIDIITYTLADIIDKNKGWGFLDETFNSLNILKKYYDYDWFKAGDKDLATHIYRTHLFRKGFTKAQITSIICKKLDVKSHLIPMCNEEVQTIIKTPSKSMHFEEYYIKYQCEPEVIGIQFEGIEQGKPIEGVLEYINKCRKIIICPSNPIVSIGTILSIAGIRAALSKVRKKIYSISPIIQGSTIKGPADKLMRSIGLNVSCVGVAKYYEDFLGHFIIDTKDSKLKPEIENLGIKTYCFDTIMNSERKKKDLAQFVIDL